MRLETEISMERLSELGTNLMPAVGCSNSLRLVVRKGLEQF